MAPLKTLLLIAYISFYLVISNIIVIDEFNPNINEYYCTPEESCTIGCLSTGSCSGTTLFCPSNNDCTIICDGRSNTATKTCFNSTIHAEHSNELSITITAHTSNAEFMTIYTPYNTNTPSISSIITCNSDIANHNQCKNINIHTNKGFNDIQLQCNDGTSLCHISGNMQCQYTNNNICNLFTYKNNEIGYQCNDNNFCLTEVIPPKLPIISSTSIDIVTQNGGMESDLYVSKSSSNKDIHSLILVIVGTVIICCVILLLLSLCGVLFVKFNKETVEEILIQRYMSGRGSSLSNIPIFNANSSKDSNDSNDSHSHSTSSSDTQTIDITHTHTNTIQYSDDIDTTMNTNTNTNTNDDTMDNIISHMDNMRTTNLNECNSQYENEMDELDDIQNDINIISNHCNGITNVITDSINPLYNISIDNIQEDELSGDYDSIVVIGEQTQSISINSQYIDDNDNEAMINTDIDNIHINNNIHNDDEKIQYILMNEKHRQIHEEHIRNRHKCYGYSQPEILYEEDENYTDDSTNTNTNTNSNSNHENNEEEKNIILETNKSVNVTE
eukprot:475267_1